MAFNTNGAATAGPKGLFSIDPLDVRLQVKTKAQLNDIKAGAVYESIHVFCQEDKKFYTPKNYSTAAPTDNVEWEEVKYGGTWGNISGTLANQTDLNTELTGLQNQINDLSGRGRFLSLWNCAEGKPTTEPDYEDAYTYKTGDYFIVGTVASGEAKNYKPTGTTYTKGQAASTVEETDEVSVDDTYYYDGSTWHLQVNHGKTVSFANLAGQPSDNTALANALNGKQDNISDLEDIRANASAGAGAATTIAGYGDIVTHNASEFATPGDIPTVPTNVSAFTNDAGYVTADHHDSTKQDVLTQGTGITISDNTISANTATNTSAGIAKLYTSTGTNTDGSMDQNSITAALAELNEVEVSTTEPTDPSVEVWINPDGEGFDPNTKQDKLIPGPGVVLEDNVISVGSLDYEEGAGIKLELPPELPAGYRPLSYIESDGTSCIDMDTTLRGDETIYLKFLIEGITYSEQGFSPFFGYSDKEYPLHEYRIERAQSHSITYSTTNDGNGPLGNLDQGEWHEYVVTLGEGSRLVDYDNKRKYGGPIGDWETTHTVALFGEWHNEYTDHTAWSMTPYHRRGLKIARFTQKNLDGSLKIDMIPAKRTEDNVAGMYDVVRDRFFPATIGNGFIAGEDRSRTVVTNDTVGGLGIRVLKPYHIPEEYEEWAGVATNGTQKLDTGMIYRNTDSIEICYGLNAGPSSGDTWYLYHGRSGSSNAAVGCLLSGSTRKYTYIWSPSYEGNTEINFNVGIGGKVYMMHQTIKDGSNLNFCVNNRVLGKSSSPSSSWRTDYTVVLFGNGTSSNQNAKMNFYYYRLWNKDGVLLQQLIPVREKSTNTLGLYDTVSRRFITPYEGDALASIPSSQYAVSPTNAITIESSFKGSDFITVSDDVISLEAQYFLKNRNDVTGVGTFYDSRTTDVYQTPSISYQTIIGYHARGGGYGATAFGCEAFALDNRCTAIGHAAKATYGYSTALGSNVEVTSSCGVAVGYGSRATGNGYNTALGYNSVSTNAYGVSVGYSAQAKSQYSTAIGASAVAQTYNYATAIGYGALAQHTSAVAVGPQTKALAGYGVALGNTQTEANGTYSIAIGATAKVESGKEHSIQLGTGTNSTAGKLQVWNWELLDKTTGKIPAERIDLPESASALSDLTDVSLSSLANGQSLVYNNGVWSNAKAGVDVSYDATHKRLKFA